MEHVRPPILAACRPLYPEVVAFSVPRGTRERLRDRAPQDGTSVSALVRHAVERTLTGQATALDARP